LAEELPGGIILIGLSDVTVETGEGIAVLCGRARGGVVGATSGRSGGGVLGNILRRFALGIMLIGLSGRFGLTPYLSVLTGSPNNSS